MKNHNHIGNQTVVDAQPVALPTHAKIYERPGLAWIDLKNPSKKDLNEIAEQYHLHDLHIEESFSKSQLPQLESERHYLFLQLYFPKSSNGITTISAAHVSIFVGKDFLITIHEGTSRVITDIFDAYDQATVTPNFNATTPVTVLYRIIGSLVGELTALVEQTDTELDAIEGLVFDNQGSDAYVIGQLRQRVMKLRRIISTSRDVLGELADIINEFSGENLSRHYNNTRKLVQKLWEEIEEARETIEIYKDADFTTNTEKTNEALAVLTLMFTLTIPATVFGAFYGMNVLLPGGLSTHSWTFFGEYTTLIVIGGASVLSGIIMFIYFRRKRWF